MHNLRQLAHAGDGGLDVCGGGELGQHLADLRPPGLVTRQPHQAPAVLLSLAAQLPVTEVIIRVVHGDAAPDLDLGVGHALQHLDGLLAGGLESELRLEPCYININKVEFLNSVIDIKIGFLECMASIKLPKKKPQIGPRKCLLEKELP